MQGEGEWKVKKHGKESRRVWLKLHIGIDAFTPKFALEIRAVEATENSVGSPTVLPALLDQPPPKSPWAASVLTGLMPPGNASRPLRTVGR